MNNNCPFCNAAIQNAVFAASDNFYAVYNISPILPGHSMVIPKSHIPALLEMDDQLLAEMMTFSKKITRFLNEYFQTTGFDWSLQEGEEAGQSIRHVHLHIIPRRTNDMSSAGAWYVALQDALREEIDDVRRERLTPVQMQQICVPLRKAWHAFKERT